MINRLSSGMRSRLAELSPSLEVKHVACVRGGAYRNVAAGAATRTRPGPLPTTRLGDISDLKKLTGVDSTELRELELRDVRVSSGEGTPRVAIQQRTAPRPPGQTRPGCLQL